MFKLIDSHSHLHFRAYDTDRAEVLARTRALGIGCLTVGTMLATSRAAVEFAEISGEDVFASIGLHPNYAGGQDYEDENEIAPNFSSLAPSINKSLQREIFNAAAFEQLARHHKVVAIGETGLDYYRLPSGENPEIVRELQKESLRAHFALSDSVNKPLSLHCREAHDDLIQEIDRYRAKQGRLAAGGVVHCFTATQRTAESYLARGFYISFTGVITFLPKKSAPMIQEQLWEVVRAVPLERLLIETDAPYLAPLSHRGKRNEPIFIVEVAEKIAALRGISYEAVAQATTENATRLFKLL